MAGVQWPRTYVDGRAHRVNAEAIECGRIPGAQNVVESDDGFVCAKVSHRTEFECDCSFYTMVF